MAIRRLLQWRFWLGLGLLLLACQPAGSPTDFSPSPTIPSSPQATPTFPATATPLIFPTSPPATPTVTPLPPDTGWELLQPGLERRQITLFSDNGAIVERVYILRLEPAGFQFDVHYAPDQPLFLNEWQAQTNALIVVNGGYFTPEFTATGLVISEGVASGVSYGDFAGMLAITATGPELRWLRDQPYDPTEPLLSAFQSFPLLVKPGGLLGFPADQDNGQTARRTVIGQDETGRLLIILAPFGHFTLHHLSQYLTQSDLNLHIALNLDGGTSTGLLLTTLTTTDAFPAFTRLPTILAIKQR